MIGKILPHRSGFGSITSYALFGRQRENPERVEWVAMRNLEGVSPEAAHRVMEATSRKSKRVQKPRGHMIVSWARSDRVSSGQMINIMDMAMKELGLSDLQAMYVAHNDTDHQHVHAIFNRVHPETGRVAKDGFERLKLRRSLMQLEQTFRLEQTPYKSRGQHEVSLFSEKEISKRENRPELKRMSKVRCEHLRQGLDYTFKSSKGWGDLDNKLRRRGYQLQGAGAGVRLVDRHSYAKLSDVLPDKMNTKGLTERWGSFSNYYKRLQEKEREKRQRELALQRKRQRQKLKNRQRQMP